MFPKWLALFLVICMVISKGSTGSFNSMFNTRSIASSTLQLKSEVLESISNGAKLAMDHCKEAFKWNRWNCPENTFSRKYNHPITKEFAYSRAIMSAGIAHAITKNCSRGDIEGCGCNTKHPVSFEGKFFENTENFVKINSTKGSNKKVAWSWGGCSDDVDFGYQVSKNYLDELESSNGPQAFIHLHNNMIGREVVKNSMVKHCRCHGVSGSCTVQTCWMQTAPFPVIAAKLKEKYESSKLMVVGDEASNSARQILPDKFPTASIDSLVYLEESPNYCEAHDSFGWPGTKGRNCSRNKTESLGISEKRSCRDICRSCGHRVKKVRRVAQVRCNCKFNWCCEVKCDTCNKLIEEYYCY